MAVPRNRVSKAKSKSRRAQEAKTPVQKATCPNCGNTHRHHTICTGCGYYGGRIAIEMSEES